MSHMVIYRGSDGKPGYHQTDDIHDAVGFVEQMRNKDGVEHARIFRLEEVIFQYKPYYRVELTNGSGAQLEGSSVAQVESGTSSNGDSDADGSADSNGSGEADGDEAGVGGAKRGLFGR